MNEQPTRKIIVPVELAGETFPIEFSQREYALSEEVADAQGCSVAELVRDAAVEFVRRADIAKARRKIIKFPRLT
jgi:hypothetical protein